MNIPARQSIAERLWFVYDVFTICHRCLRGLYIEVKKQGMHLPYEIITRGDRIKEELIQLLKDSGCFLLWIGTESGSQKIIDGMDRRVDVNNVREMIVKVMETDIEA